MKSTKPFSIFFSAALTCSTLFACNNPKPSNQIELNGDTSDQPMPFYEEARKLSQEEEYNKALTSLENAFDNGFKTPMSSIQDSALYSLCDDPRSRHSLRTLLNNYASENEVTMVRKSEEGTPIIILGNLIDENTGEAISGATIELVHTDKLGQYFHTGEEVIDSMFYNPRIFGYMKSSESGEFKAHSIRPSGYPDDEGLFTPAHVHFGIHASGYRPYYSEFLLGDDVNFISEETLEYSNHGQESLIAESKTIDGIITYKITIPLQKKNQAELMEFYNFSANTPMGEEIKMSDFQGKTVLIVNTATECGLTPQFEGLEKLHQDYKDQGLVIIGFPCNQFLSQEPLSNEDMEETCRLNHGVTFQLTEKIEVNGENTHPIYDYLKNELKGTLGNDIKWNFTKFLISPDGVPIKRFSPTTKPNKIEKHILKLLK